MKNPWTTISEKKIYENQWISVSEHQVINPSGKPGIYGKVSFLNKAIGIIPVDEQLNTWLVGQYRYTLNEYSWEIPMGGGLINEDVIENAKRELKEETGLFAELWTPVMRIHTSNSVTDEEGFVFLAQELTIGSTDFDETEQLELCKLPLVDAIAMVMEGKITDAISIAGLLKVAKLLDI